MKGKYLGLLGLLAGCGPEPQVGCQTDLDCREPRVCEVNVCVEVVSDYENNSDDDISEDLEERCVPAVEVCDAQDNDCNDLVDELGCGFIYASNGRGIRRIDLSTMTYDLVFEGDMHESSPSLSLDSRKIAFRNDEGLMSVNINSGSVTRVVTEGILSSPAWLDGDILYSRRFSETSVIYRVNSNGTNNREVATTLGWAEGLAPGPKLAYTQYFRDAGNAELYVMDLNGANDYRITEISGWFTPLWREGRIYYECSDPEEDWALCSILPSGGDRRLELEGDTILAFNADKSKGVLYPWGGIWDLASGNIYSLPSGLLSSEERSFRPFAWK